MFLRICFFIIVFPLYIYAQNPAPAKPQSKSILLMNAVAHLGNGKIIENAAIGFKDGKINLVADATVIRLKAGAYDTSISCSGKHIYPGLIALNTDIGLREIELIRATNDYVETGGMNPSARAIIAYNTDSKIIPTVRSNGVLLAQICPEGGTISGTSSVVELDGWNWEDAAYKIDEGVHINWPSMRIYSYPNAPTEEEQRDRMQKNLNKVYSFFRDAKAYASAILVEEKNLHFEAMRGLYDGTKKLYIHCGDVKEIISAVNFCHELGIKMILVGGTDAWRVTTLLKENNIPVILGREHSLPPRQDDDVDLPYKLPYLLKKEGVEVALSVDGYWQVRNLMFNAGTGSAYGLTKEEALETITLEPAKILGIDKTTGTIEEGKDATIIVSSGDILDMLSNNIEHAYIRGKEINLDNVQKQLYKKYMDKYGLKE
jgi:imidazolonepropionase-like amidohydrolase